MYTLVAMLVICIESGCAVCECFTTLLCCIFGQSSPASHPLKVCWQTVKCISWLIDEVRQLHTIRPIGFWQISPTAWKPAWSVLWSCHCLMFNLRSFSNKWKWCEPKDSAQHFHPSKVDMQRFRQKVTKYRLASFSAWWGVFEVNSRNLQLTVYAVTWML